MIMTTITTMIMTTTMAMHIEPRSHTQPIQAVQTLGR